MGPGERSACHGERTGVHLIQTHQYVTAFPTTDLARDQFLFDRSHDGAFLRMRQQNLRQERRRYARTRLIAL